MIIREENNNVSNKLINIASAIMNKVDNSNIDKSYAMARITMVGNAILDNEYKRMYQKLVAEGQDVKGLIRPTHNSWLNLVSNTTNQTFDKFGISPYNNDILENLSKRLSLEIDTYKNKYSFMVENYNTYLNDMIKTLPKDPLVENSFTVQLIKKLSLADVVEEKDWLNKLLLDGESDKLPTNMSNSIYDLKNDLELKMLVDDAFKTLTGDTIEVMNKVLASQSVDEYKASLSNLRAKDINASLGLVIVLRDKLLSLSKTDEDYVRTGTLLNLAIDAYRRLDNQYKVFIASKVVVIGLEVKGKDYIIYAIEDNFNSYINDPSGDMKTILGAIFTEFNVYTNSLDNLYKPLYIKNDDLIVNKASYNSLRNSIQNSYILKNRNETASSLRAYYLIALDKIMVDKDDQIRKEAEEYINSLSINKLYDTYPTTMYIVENFVASKTNFKEFSKGVQEAKELLNTTEIKPLAGYATLRLILLYLISQTEII